MKQAKLLYVDDEIINLQILEINFKEKYQVFTAQNALDGLEIINENPDISVVISDMRMPLISGIEFIKMARAKYPKISYYILTGFDINE